MPTPVLWQYRMQDRDAVIFVETAQGFSLGINSGFYPYTTSRECTVGQALADARIPPRFLRRVAMTVRTFPIRVGNTAGSSGPCYHDQEETSWEELGQTPELTTVTKRVRRVFTFSWEQYRQACRVNQPDLVFANFLNYLKEPDAQQEFLYKLETVAQAETGIRPIILGGHGPMMEDVRLERGG